MAAIKKKSKEKISKRKKARKQSEGLQKSKSDPLVKSAAAGVARESLNPPDASQEPLEVDVEPGK